MFTINLSWKSFNVSLPEMAQWLSANAGESFCGSSANVTFQVHFTSEPTQEIKDAIDAHWEAVDESAEVAKELLAAHKELAVHAARNAMLTSDMASWIPAERKLIMNMELTDADKAELLIKYPQT